MSRVAPLRDSGREGEASLQRFRFTVDEYHRLAEAGILTEDDRVELIEGEIVMMTPIGLRHAACVDRLNALLTRALGGRAIVRVQNPIRFGDSEPQPDLALLAPRQDFYASRAPGPADILLLVEVAESSLGIDRRIKLPLYARAGISEVWIVDLGAGEIHAFRSPTEDGYAERQTSRPGGTVAARALDLQIPVGSILP